ncbi:hypothetical protein MCOR02_005976 [Pyricularia oryzae]|nr:hypothetical protein MCOR02_005976 [Pyricularia oryzae]
MLSQGAKRQHDFSQTEDPGPAKKGKLRELGSKDNATIVPAGPYSGFASSPWSSSGNGTFGFGFGYEYQAGPLAHKQNNGAAVIKVIRSPSGPVEEGGSGKIAQAIHRSGHVWVQEVKNHSRLSEQPSVIRLFDADSKVFALYMEHVEAPSLVYYIQPNAAGPYCTLTRTNATEVLRNISTALSYIYRQKIVHNDIKPDNILILRLAAPSSSTLASQQRSPGEVRVCTRQVLPGMCRRSIWPNLRVEARRGIFSRSAW